jgi:exodeoxyribonuclease VII large subunit
MTMTTRTGEPRRVLRLRDLNRAIGEAIAARFGEDVWVVGEVSSLRERNGTRYFALVEHDERGGRTVAKLPAVVLRWDRDRFDAEARQLDGFALADGVEVLVRGSVEVYEPWGEVRLRVRGIDPAHTLGRMQAARDQLVADLVRRGLLRRNADRPVGQPPLHVGLVTAPDSQAEHDLRAVLAASGWGFRLVRAGARVQGPACETDVAAAIAHLAELHLRRPLDVVVLIRGGGSAVDLQGFDTPGVAEAIVGAPFPVWTGIGHQQDRSVADEVAHTAWATPTAVGRGLVDAVDDCELRVREAVDGLVDGVDRVRRRAVQRLVGQAASLAAGAGAGLRGAGSTLERNADQLGQLARAQLRRTGTDLDRHRRALVASAERATVPAQWQRLATLDARVRAADPVAQLARGFSITHGDRGEVIRSVHGLVPGTRLHTRLADGTVTSRVEEAEEGGARPRTRSLARSQGRAADVDTTARERGAGG